MTGAPPDAEAVRRMADALWGGLLRSPVAQERAWGVERWADHLGDDADLLPLLDDDAPLVRRHAGVDHLVEVRAPALVALQDRYRTTGRWPYGLVVVRRAMPVPEAVTAARATLDGRPDAAEVAQRARDWLDAVVRPPCRDEDACLAYAVLRTCGLLRYERQPVRPGSMLTALQEQVHASQQRSVRPAPHLRFETVTGRTVGYWYHEGGRWVLDVDESPDGRDVARLLAKVLRLPQVAALGEDHVHGRLQAVADVVGRLRPTTLVLDEDPLR